MNETMETRAGGAVTARETEFAVLRQTVSTRGTARPIVLMAAALGWGGGAVALLLFGDLPVAAVVPLLTLGAGFEAIHVLHVGVERIGRYLQVEYESEDPGPKWETTAMAFGPPLPGSGVDPLFTVFFTCCALFNLATVVILEPTPLEFLVMLALHAVFVVRVVRARLAAARQRSVELDRLRAARAARLDAHPSS
jgi:hypothetical protein